MILPSKSRVTAQTEPRLRDFGGDARNVGSDASIRTPRILPQPPVDNPFVPSEWVHRYHRLELRRGSDGKTMVVPCTAANFFLMDLNPRWYVDQLMRTNGDALFILYLDTTNACTDRCGMCFTEQTRRQEGFGQRLDVPLALRRIHELRDRYPDTFKMVSMAGPGEPLNHRAIDQLLHGSSDLGLATRVYTAGKRLREPTIRAALLASTSLVRVSVDAVQEETFQNVHGVKGLDERFSSIEALIGERDAQGSGPLVGMHFVIQKSNYREILPFAEKARDMGCDFVVFGQETFGHVQGGFSKSDYFQVIADLRQVEFMHDDTFASVVPRFVQRQTYTEFDKTYFATPEVLNRCHNSKHRIFFGVQNDFSACWLATLDSQFRAEAYIGPLSDDTTMDAVSTIIEHGVGAVIDQGAHLSCNSCVASNYNYMVDAILAHLEGQASFETTMVAPEPGVSFDSESDDAYRFLLVGDSAEDLLGTADGSLGCAPATSSVPVSIQPRPVGQTIST